MKPDNSAVRWRDVEQQVDSMLSDIKKGLNAQPKRLPSKYFYDARGSELFEEICEQPEYYLTRTELSILQSQSAAIANAIGPDALVVEYGSGSAIKTERLLRALHTPTAYVPVEISASALAASVDNLSRQFPNLEMLPVCADFNAPLQLPKARRYTDNVLIFFPGSTIGNFERRDAIALLEVMQVEMGDQGAALIGIDLKKDAGTLEAAYNDAAGVTAAFTLNLLERLNRELDMDFATEHYRHQARYNPMAGRIETHIVSQLAQSVSLGQQSIQFGAGEKMLVECSCKYALSDFSTMADKAGMSVDQYWTDADQMFALVLLKSKISG
ncbi:MAG: L-histidine N(alpha)-methyltransferase [Panacagrimonas sp.]